MMPSHFSPSTHTNNITHHTRSDNLTLHLTLHKGLSKSLRRRWGRGTCSSGSPFCLLRRRRHRHRRRPRPRRLARWLPGPCSSALPHRTSPSRSPASGTRGGSPTRGSPRSSRCSGRRGRPTGPRRRRRRRRRSEEGRETCKIYNRALFVFVSVL